jgi:hypothetical protein
MVGKISLTLTGARVQVHVQGRNTAELHPLVDLGGRLAKVCRQEVKRIERRDQGFKEVLGQLGVENIPEQ